jgi:hypothetical protein
MAIKLVSRVLLFLAASGLLVIPIYSCGPFFESAVFTFESRPDGPDQDFAAGKIGILLPGFRSSYLVVAYRSCPV